MPPLRVAWKENSCSRFRSASEFAASEEEKADPFVPVAKVKRRKLMSPGGKEEETRARRDSTDSGFSNSSLEESGEQHELLLKIYNLFPDVANCTRVQGRGRHELEHFFRRAFVRGRTGSLLLLLFYGSYCA